MNKEKAAPGWAAFSFTSGEEFCSNADVITGAGDGTAR
jgi:hypothetical protein